MGTTSTVGIIMSAYFVGYLAGSRIGPRFIHRVGTIRTYAALAEVAAAAAGLHAVFDTPFTLIVLRALTGVCLAGIYIVMESWINASATNRNRGHLLSIYMIVNRGGLALTSKLVWYVEYTFKYTSVVRDILRAAAQDLYEDQAVVAFRQAHCATQSDQRYLTERAATSAFS